MPTLAYLAKITSSLGKYPTPTEAGATANAICLSLAETANANGVDFYRYLVKILTDLPNLDIHRTQKF